MYSSISISNKSIDYDIDKNEINLDQILEKLNKGTIKFQNIESDEVDTDNMTCNSIISNELSTKTLYLNDIKFESDDLKLKIASNNILGGIKVGSNFSIDDTGILSINTETLNYASTNDYGVIKVGDNLNIDNGILSLSGNVSIYGNLTVDGLTNFKNTIYNKLYIYSETGDINIQIDTSYKGISEIFSFTQLSTLTINVPDTYIDGISYKIILGTNTKTIVINSVSNNINGYVRIMSSDNKPKIYTATDAIKLEPSTDNTAGTIIEINSSNDDDSKWIITGDIFTHLPESEDNGNPFS